MLTVRTMLVGVACAVATLTGCSVTVDAEDATISKENLEQGISDALEKKTGQAPDSVECPSSMKAKVDESVRCELTAGSDRVGLTATITSYDDGKAGYDIQVDDELASTGDPTSTEDPTISKADLEQDIADALEETVGQRPDSVECPGSMKAMPGESIRCELTAGSDKLGLTATVTSYDNGNVKYDVKVDG